MTKDEAPDEELSFEVLPVAQNASDKQGVNDGDGTLTPNNVCVSRLRLSDTVVTASSH